MPGSLAVKMGVLHFFSQYMQQKLLEVGVGAAISSKRWGRMGSPPDLLARGCRGPHLWPGPVLCLGAARTGARCTH